MNKFLQGLAQQIYDQYGKDMSAVKVIFPNRRAGLFFTKYLAQHIQESVWLPEVMSIDDFIAQHCPWQKADKLTLIFELYDTYSQVNPTDETFDQFYFWGEMLLKDFDDIDRNMVNAKHLFSVLMRQKEMDISFDVLSEEQKEVLQRFWKHFADKQSRHKEEFLALWAVLYHVYEQFRGRLQKQNLAYDGMVHRHVAEQCKNGLEVEGTLILAGFNAFTKSEEILFEYLILEHQAQFHWDLDAYYVDDPQQEAGEYFRKHRKHLLFGKSFPEQLPNDFQAKAKSITCIGITQAVAQAKYVGEALQLLKQSNPNLPEEEVVVVLPDEQMLFPVLHSLPENFETLNITMGYPLKSTPLFGLLENLVEMQGYFRQSGEEWTVHHRPLLQVLRHSYVLLLHREGIENLIQQVTSENLIRIPLARIIEQVPELSGLILPPDSSLNLFDYLMQSILLLRNKLFEDQEDSIDSEYFYHFYIHLQQLKNTMDQRNILLTPEVFISLFRQLVQSLRLPFSGEPLNGLQIMGVLETRNLDFKHVYVLGMNEGSFPATANANSFIPYNIRKAFDLPTYDHQDSIYAYLFYRLLQKAEHITLLYSTEDSGGMKGEPSRYLAQLKYEGKLPIDWKYLSNEIRILPNKPVQIEKNELIQQQLNQYLALDGHLPKRYLSPSALNTYLDCRLKFYYQQLARLRENEEIQEEVDARYFGLLLHDALENTYKELMQRKKSGMVEKQDFEFLRKKAEECIDEAFATTFGRNRTKKFSFEGRNIIIRKIIRKFVLRVLEMDYEYAPFEILGLETEGEDNFRYLHPMDDKKLIGLDGKIDRLDRKGSTIRVLDYKTGKDEKSFGSLEALFDRGIKNRNKAAMQALFYSMLYIEKHQPEAEVAPAIINAKELFDQHFDWKIGQREPRGPFNPITDTRLYLPEFKANLNGVLSELFDPNVAFTQTDDLQKCANCSYVGLCRRN